MIFRLCYSNHIPGIQAVQGSAESADGQEDDVWSSAADVEKGAGSAQRRRS